MDFQHELFKRQTPIFYRQMAAAYLLAAEQIEKDEAHSTCLEYKRQAYRLENLQVFSFQYACQEHIWSYDESNYRCVNCGEWRSLQPIQVELPQELLLQILSYLGRNTLLKLSSGIRMRTIYENCYQILQRLNPYLEFKNQFYYIDLQSITAYIECKELGNYRLNYSYTGEKNLINRNTTTGTVKMPICSNKVYSITAFIIATWNRCNEFFRRVRVDKRRIMLRCQEEIRKEFRHQLSNCNSLTRIAPALTLFDGATCLSKIAYQECCLISFGVPLSVTYAMKNLDTVTVFEKALSSTREEQSTCIETTRKAIKEKNLLEACYGFILIWFAQKTTHDRTKSLRKWANDVFA